mmetsp:Transcript_2339/g.5362  ORF Transcript_2339/g.5362 Transcript_2339/m.5362 type:complete len:321 (-) Transcript_2339:479-1441(-)
MDGINRTTALPVGSLVRATRSMSAHVSSVRRTKQSAATSGSSPCTKSDCLPLWELPEILLYHIGQFVSGPTERASFFCHQIAPLCRASYESILVEEEKSVGLWDLVLRGDYGVQNSRHETQRASKRLKRSPVHKVRDAHNLMIANTEFAYSALWELSYSSKKNALTKQKLAGILNEFGPVMVNRTMGSGGNFLVEVCRCRKTSPNNVLNCVQELVERRDALVNIPTRESKNSSLTALCVASVRGMPKVVEYLLSNDALASKEIRCSGRFRLYKNPRKSLRCNDTTPLEFSTQMLKAEKEEGATKQELKDLNRCIKLLKGK